MGLLESLLQRLPLSPAMFYLPVGFTLGPAGIGLIDIEPEEHAALLTGITEIALLISLFSVGLKLRVKMADPLWWLPLRLGVLTMLFTTALLALVGVYLLHLSWGAAVLLGAILAPTDPILASDVQIKDTGDNDRIRFGLSAEGGLNDGTTYPLVMVGLGMMAVPEAAAFTQPNAVLLVLWGWVGGVGSGWLMGIAVGRLVVYLRREFQMALGMEEFLTLGMIALSFGIANLVGAVGFVAVFAAGVAVRHLEFVTSGHKRPSEVIGAVAADDESDVATHPEKAPAYMTESVLGFNRKLESIAECIMVLLVGSLLSRSGFSGEGAMVAVLLFFLIRPVTVFAALPWSKTSMLQRRLIGWFGIRGIGSLYYLVFALQFKLAPSIASRFVPLILTVVAMSVVLHGVSATPLMELYRKRRR